MDTATLLYWMFEPARLSPDAEYALRPPGDLLVSSISLWEIGIKVKRGKLSIPMSTRELRDRLTVTDRVKLLPVDDETWLTNVELPWAHADPADRTVVATAQLQSSDLVTPDTEIRAFYPRAIW